MKKILFLPLFAIQLFSISIAQTASTASSPIVKIANGSIKGTVEQSGIKSFKGIPFAAPPIGELRWKAPQPVQSWSGVKVCDEFGPSPMQNKPASLMMYTEEFLIPKEPISEDCLYLNVWSGAKFEKQKSPVIVWIYGGGFQSGGSAVPIYDGEALARKGVVFVSINYRVGIFGFLAHPELTKESEHKASGNYGLMDQIAALKWVKQNIAAFGGDPNNVTIAGQSAGSFGVNFLVASPLAKNLFKKAIAESGAALVPGPFLGITLQEGEQDGEKIASALHASSLADLRKIPSDTLLNAQLGLRRLIIDGYVLPQSIADIFMQGKENKVSLLTGWNEDEGILFTPLKNAEAFSKEAEKGYGADAQTFLKYYPATSDSIAAISQLNLSRDQTFGVQNYTWANIQSNRGSKVFLYRFRRKLPTTGEAVKYGAFHTGEVPYAYDNLKFVNRPWEKVDQELATVMSSHWANFAKTGNPNGEGLPRWDAYNTADKKIMILDVKSESEPIPDAAQLDFLYKKMSGK